MSSMGQDEETPPVNAAALATAAEEETGGGGGGGGGNEDGFEMGEAEPLSPPQRDNDDDENNSTPMKGASSSSLANGNSKRSSIKKSNSSLYTPPSFQTVGWFRQLSCVLRKNALLLWRRPVSLFCMLISSIGSVLLAWARGKNVEGFDATQLTQCGTLSSTYTEQSYNDVPLTLNENWRNGLAVTLMAFGPMMLAMLAFLVVHAELEMKMLGSLRALGLRESVYWTSWQIPFILISVVNALLGALTATLIASEVHVYQHLYFGGMFGSLFFLNIALVSASLFLAACCGTSRHGAPWLVVLMFIGTWIPFIVIAATSTIPYSAASVNTYGLSASPTGLFWINANTTQSYQTYVDTGNDTWTWTYTQCDKPIMNQQQGTFWKTQEQKEQVLPSEYFMGCYFGSGYTSYMWNKNTPGSKFGAFILYLFPYTHFLTMWGNFLGLTAMPNRSFELQHASWSPEALAIFSLPSSPLDSQQNAKGTSLFAQGSTLNLNTDYILYEDSYYFDDNGNRQYLDTCPGQNNSEYFCQGLSQCAAALDPAPTMNSPSVLDMMGFLFSLCVFYTFLAAYWAQIFPGGNGAPQKFYFFLLPRYWRSVATATTDSASGAGVNASPTAPPTSVTVGVVVEGVRKQYGDFEALKGVSMEMECGEITALLGHNGAGKTTLSHVLSCEVCPSAGDVRVFGHSVTQDPYSVRQLVGLCKQDDYLYPNLSAREHLLLFGGLRGVESSVLAETVNTWLESVDLSLVQNHYTSSFSGGMKRRLSVAMATIGGRPLLLLDEPTTGMDSLSRRSLWRHIDAIKKGRVVLLTTHAMEEADLLSDMVAVMRKGELAAFGTPLALKAEHGSAMQFSILAEREHVAATKEAIFDRFAINKEWITVDAGSSGNITVNITQIRQGENAEGVDVEALADFVAWLEKKESGVSEYGFCNSSLEEVFLKVTEGEQDEVKAHDEIADNDVCCPCWCKSFLLCCLHGPCRCCCCPRPHHVQEAGAPDEELQELNRTAAADGDGVSEEITFKPALTVQRQSWAIFVFAFSRGWTGKRSIGSWIMYGLLLMGVVLIGLSAGGFYDPNASLTFPTVALSLILVSLVSPIYLDRKHGSFYLMRAQGLLKRSFLLGQGLYAFSLTLIISFVVLSAFYATPLFREPILCGGCDDDYDCPDCPWFSFGSRRIVSMTSVYWWEAEGVSLYATFTAGSYGKILGTAIMFSLTMPGALFASSYIPGIKIGLVIVAFVCLTAGVLPLIIYFIRIREPDQAIQCSWNICNTTLSSFNIDTVESIGSEFLNCIGLDVNVASLGGLCIPPVAAVLPQFGLFQMLSMTLMSDLILTSDPPEYVEQVLIPKMGGNVKCSGNSCQFPFARKLYGQNVGFMFLGAFVLFMIGYILLSLISFPGAWVLRAKHRICWWRCSKSGHELEHSGNTTVNEQAILEEVIAESDFVASIIQPLLEPRDPSSVERGENENGDIVLADYENIPRDTLPPVLTHKLGKVYPAVGGLPPKVALASLDLHVPKGEVLGLLGQNGAGKTTALKILSVAHESTSGLGLLSGYDVSCEQISVFERLGSCPQFDSSLWPSLSVKLHLEFFARLKGLPNNKVKAIARSIACTVGLGSPEVYRRDAGGLSGGMRRRLSIAISLIGAPSVILLDEPTTGLDPCMRKKIWGLINSFCTNERAIIITTHMMIEADTLCNRIAIMARGRLKVIATQQHLKDRFGSGYLLQLNLLKSSPECQETAMDFVRTRLHKEAILQTKQAKTLHVALPRDLNLTQVFRMLYSEESASIGGINQFLLSQSSLEDVFLALGDS